MVETASYVPQNTGTLPFLKQLTLHWQVEDQTYRTKILH